MLSKLKPIWSLLLLILCVAVQQSTPAEFIKVPDLPIGLPRCTKDDRDLNECLKSGFQQLLKLLKNGVPELNIPIIEPWYIDLNGFQHSTGNVQLDIQVSNVRIFGITDTVFDTIDFRLLKDDGVQVLTITHLPHLYIEGLYSGEIAINELKFQPHGYFNISVENLKMTRHPQGKLHKRNGHIYLRLFKYNAIPEVDDLKFYISGLTPDPALNELLLEIINKYWRQIYRALWPEMSVSWEPLVIRNGNDFYSAFPFDLIMQQYKLI